MRPRTSSAVFALGAAAFGALSAVPWLHATAVTVLGSANGTATGADAVAALPTGALIWAAAAVANLLAGALARRIIGSVAAATAAGLAWATASFLVAPAPVAVTSLTEVTGTTTIDNYRLTAFPLISLVALLALALAALVLAIVPAPRQARTRYERRGDVVTDTPINDVRNLDQWDALTRGQDPTLADQDVSERPERG